MRVAGRGTLLLAAVLSLVADTPHAAPAAKGSISGRVRVLQKGVDVTDLSQIDGDVWVWLVDKDRPPSDNRSLPKKSIEQVNDSRSRPFFDPHVLVVPKGTEIEFPNHSTVKITHSVFSSDPHFDLGHYGPGQKPVPSHTFEAATPPKHDIQIYCDIHKCMWARLKVVDVASPNDIRKVGKTGGTYTFTNLLPGRYEVYAWVVGSDEVATHELRVTDGALSAPTLKLDLHAVTTVHMRSDGSTYPSKQYVFENYGGLCP